VLILNRPVPQLSRFPNRMSDVRVTNIRVKHIARRQTRDAFALVNPNPVV